MLLEPEDNKRRTPKGESFFNYEDELPQDRLAGGSEYIEPQAPTVAPQRTAQNIYADLFNYEPPKPTYDPNRPEEMARLARASAIAKGITLLGDTFSSAIGGNVVRRPKDEKELGYLQSMYGYIDDYNKRMDQWNYQNYMAKLRAAQQAINQMNIDRQFGASEDQRKWSREFQEGQAAKSDERYRDQIEHRDRAYGDQLEHRDWEKGMKEADFALRKEYQAEMLADKRKRTELAEMAERIKSLKMTGDMPSDFIYDDDGRQYGLRKNELQKLMSDILTDTDIEDRDMSLISASLGGTSLTTNQIFTMVNKYWTQSPKAIRYMMTRDKIGQQDIQQSQSRTQLPDMWRSPQSQVQDRAGGGMFLLPEFDDLDDDEARSLFD